MEKVSVSYTYDVKYWISDDYCLTVCGKIINAARGTECRQFLRGSRRAVYINGTAQLVDELKEFKRQPCPF